MEYPTKYRTKTSSVPRTTSNPSNNLSFDYARESSKKSRHIRPSQNFGVYIGFSGTILTKRSYKKPKAKQNQSLIHDRSDCLLQDNSFNGLSRKSSGFDNDKVILPSENHLTHHTKAVHFQSLIEQPPIGSRTTINKTRPGTSQNSKPKLNNTVDYFKLTKEGLDTSHTEEIKAKGAKNEKESLANQFLVYVPKDVRESMTGSQKAFYSFRELSNQAKNAYPTILKNKVTGENTKETQKTISEDQSKMVKKFLAFNKKQEKSFISESEVEKEQLIACVIKKQGDEYLKRKRMPPVKIFPSLSRQQSTIDENGGGNLSPMLAAILQDSRLEDLVTHEAIETEFELNYEFYWHDNMKERFCWQPDAKEGHTLTLVGGQLVLYGGVSALAVEDIAILDTETRSWSKLQVSGNAPIKKRHGHSACEFNNSLLVFGGQNNFNGAINLRECLNDVRIFNIYKKEWKYITCDGQAINARRNHAAAIHSINMYVYGGINIEGKCLSDVWTLNLHNFSWSKLTVSNEKECGVAFHTILPCFIESVPQNSRVPSFLDAPQEILYSFGGRDNKGCALNVFKILKLSPKKYYWKYPKIQGTPPAPRYGHTMIAYKELNLLIIYGGRSDKIENQSVIIPFHEVCVLDLKLMTWMSVRNLGYIPESLRYNHAAAVIESEMIIFGGVGSREYTKDSLVFAEMDQTKVKNLNSLHNKAENILKKPNKDRYNRKNINVTIRNQSTLAKKLSQVPLSGEGRCMTPDNSNMRKTALSWLPVPRSVQVENEYEVLKAKAIMTKK